MITSSSLSHFSFWISVQGRSKGSPLYRTVIFVSQDVELKQSNVPSICTSVNGGPPQCRVDIRPEAHVGGVDGGGDVVHHRNLHELLGRVDCPEDGGEVGLPAGRAQGCRGGGQVDLARRKEVGGRLD